MDENEKPGEDESSLVEIEVAEQEEIEVEESETETENLNKEPNPLLNGNKYFSLWESTAILDISSGEKEYSCQFENNIEKDNQIPLFLLKSLGDFSIV